MASNTFLMTCADGVTRRFERETKQGRTPLGLSAPIKIRLYESDSQMLAQKANALGEYWNMNAYIRELVHRDLYPQN